MVVRALKAITLIGATLMSADSWGQGGSIRSWVDSTEVVQDRPFWLFVEASGETIEMPQITQSEGLVINSSRPQQTTSVTIGGRRRLQTIKLSYSTMALRPGEVIVPPQKARINGRVLQTEPITLNVLPPPEGTPPRPNPVRAWVSESEVAVGEPFWIYLEATGSEITLPGTLEIEGITIDPRNSKQSMSFSSGRRGQGTTKKRGFYAVATRPGKITVPPIEIRVSGRTFETEAIEITAEESTVASVPPAQETPSAAELKQDDLVFIEMDINKYEVYQGEPVLLTKQLWRIKYRRISSGPYRGGLIVDPTTEGFYVHNLEPGAFEAMRGPWTYEVTETRKLLYPTRAGDLRVGQWHWEGIALINRHSIITNDKLYFELDAGPIDIKVKRLPKSAPGFTGAVGEFDVSASLETESVTQGVPLKFTLTVRGWGNPDAIGAPEFPELAWASSNKPEATHRFLKRSGDGELQMAKYFTYTLTPLKYGAATVPSFNFVYFNPESEVYVRKAIGPFELEVLRSGEVAQRLVIPSGAGIIERNIDILAEDIQPLLGLSRSIDVNRPSRVALPSVLAAPVLIYLGLSLFMLRRRRFATNIALARAHKAKTSGLKRLRGVAEADEPADALYRALIGFVGDLFNLEEYGLTSADVTREFENRSIDPGLSERTVRILKACERARYASQELSGDEITALLSAAKACMNELKSSKKKARRS